MRARTQKRGAKSVGIFGIEKIEFGFYPSRKHITLNINGVSADWMDARMHRHNRLGYILPSIFFTFFASINLILLLVFIGCQPMLVLQPVNEIGNFPLI